MEPFLEPTIEELPPGIKLSTSGDPKKLKRIKKKLDELNRKIRHSGKKHDGMIHKRNSLRKAIEALNPILPGGGGYALPPVFLHHPKTAQGIKLKLSDFKDTLLRHILQVKPVR